MIRYTAEEMSGRLQEGRASRKELATRSNTSGKEIRKEERKKEEEGWPAHTFPAVHNRPPLKIVVVGWALHFALSSGPAGRLHPQTDTREKCHHTPPGPFNTHITDHTSCRSSQNVGQRNPIECFVFNCLLPAQKEYFSIFIIDISVSPIDNRLFTVAGCVQRVVETREDGLIGC